jgi:hypothetical protein
LAIVRLRSGSYKELPIGYSSSPTMLAQSQALKDAIGRFDTTRVPLSTKVLMQA